MQRWEYRDDSSNKDYQINSVSGALSDIKKRLLSQGYGTPKFLLYVGKDYSDQIIGLRWEVTDEYDPTLKDHQERGGKHLDTSQPVLKLWNQIITDHPLPRNLTLNQYIDLLDNSQIDDIFTKYLDDNDWSFSNISSPHQFLTYQNTNNPNRRVMIFSGNYSFNSINKQEIFS